MTLKEQLEMNKNKTTPQALHVFWDIAPHLSIPFMTRIKEFFPSHRFSLYECRYNSKTFTRESNNFIQEANTCYLGWIKQGCVRRLLARIPIVCVFAQKYFVEFTFFSYFRLLLGPKNIVLHGRVGDLFNLFTLFLLKLFRKKIFLIHWGGKPHLGRIFGVTDRLAYRQFSHIFVLMAPEIDYFKPFMGNKVSCLPYNLTPQPLKPLEISSAQNSRKILLGNSAHYRNDYREVLDRLSPGEWDKITCMLNYGDETSKDITDAFVEKYRTKFGDAFYAWRETLPLEEYRKVLEESTFYVCIAKTQTGLGAISNSIRQGKTLILRGDNYKWIKSLDVKVYNYDELDDFSVETFQKLKITPDEAQENLVNYNRNLLLKYTPDLWKAEMLRVMTEK